MANYRQIHTTIWKDDWFIELSSQDKLLFIYLFSNDNSNLVGLYKISKRVIANETGIDQEYISQALARFEADKRIVFRDSIIWIVHMWRYHNNASPKVQARIKNDLELIPDLPIKHWYQYYQDTGIFNISEELIPYPYSIDTTSEETKLNLTKLKQEEEEKEPVSFRSSIRELYSKHIGTITPLMEKTLIRADQEYEPAWFDKAFEIMVGNGKKNWSYVEGILKNWQSNGYHPGKNGKGQLDRVSSEGRQHYGEWESK